jgi:anti-sigma B factor antagonist
VAGDIDHADARARALDFSVETRADDGVSIVTVIGQADLHTAPDLRAVLGDVVDGGSRAVLVDLTGATFIDSMTLGVLLGARKRLASVDGRLALAVPDKHLRRVFEITSLDQVFTIVDSLPEAAALLREGGAPA